MEATRGQHNNTLEGAAVFELYDTYGFPLDLIQLIGREHGFSVDEAGFNQELTKQKERSRAATGIETDDWQQVNEENPTEFIGYDVIQCDTTIIRYRKVTQKQREFYQLVLSQTPFYAESGGQVGDTGWLIDSQGNKTRIFDVKKENNLIVHLCESLPASLGEILSAQIEVNRRINIQKNHSATHLLHHALRTVLGTHVEQKGSLVSPDYLRFDFSHFAKVTEEEMEQVISLMEQQISANIPLNEKRNTPISEAQSMGAMALFGEKYGDLVRVIQFGESIELCGGTHVKSTGEIGLIHIQSEAAVAAGIRRIEVISGQAAETYFKQESALMTEVRTMFKNPKDVLKSIQDLMDQNQGLGKEIEALIKERNKGIKRDLESKLEEINGIPCVCQEVSIDSNSVKDILFQLKGQHPSFVGIIGNIDGDKCGLSIIISDDLVASKSWNATQWIREVAPMIQGGGGGQPFFATAGGKNSNGIKSALSALKNKL